LKLTIGFSPCPNDTFIFDALINQKPDSDGVIFDYVMEDVETLNEWALEGKLDITKLSLPAFFKSQNHYSLLNTGSALGKGVGPLLISNKQISLDQFKAANSPIAIPGLNTTANLLFDFAFPDKKNKTFLKYHEIESYLLSNEQETKFGVIIHENRFTYQQKGLYKVMDLGDFWESAMKVPIPLGCIAIKKTFPIELVRKIETLIYESLQKSWKNYPVLSDFIKENAQEMEEEIMRKHINLYVNEFSLNLGEDGRNAIDVLFKVHKKNN
jgi:1,4-dihydroxy-6-naphthoate synthase